MQRFFSKSSRNQETNIPCTSNNDPLILSLPSYLFSSNADYNVIETLPPKYEEFISSRTTLQNIFRHDTNTV